MFYELKNGISLQQSLCNKYSFGDKDYNSKQVNDIVFNEKSHLVAVFKDILIIYDSNEFLKKFYNIKDAEDRLSKITVFYETYTQIFPNYSAIRESKFLYQNIREKQNLIDNETPKSKKGKSLELMSAPILSSEINDSINKVTQYICESEFDISDISIYRVIHSLKQLDCREFANSPKNCYENGSINLSFLSLKDYLSEGITPSKSMVKSNYFKLKLNREKFRITLLDQCSKQNDISAKLKQNLQWTKIKAEKTPNIFNFKLTQISKKESNLYKELTSSGCKHKVKLMPNSTKISCKPAIEYKVCNTSILNQTPNTNNNHAPLMHAYPSSLNGDINLLSIAKVNCQKNKNSDMNSHLNTEFNTKTSQSKGHHQGSQSCKIIEKKLSSNFIIPKVNTAYSISNFSEVVIHKNSNHIQDPVYKKQPSKLKLGNDFILNFEKAHSIKWDQEYVPFNSSSKLNNNKVQKVKLGDIFKMKNDENETQNGSNKKSENDSSTKENKLITEKVMHIKNSFSSEFNYLITTKEKKNIMSLNLNKNDQSKIQSDKAANYKPKMGLDKNFRKLMSQPSQIVTKPPQKMEFKSKILHTNIIKSAETLKFIKQSPHQEQALGINDNTASSSKKSVSYILLNHDF